MLSIRIYVKKAEHDSIYSFLECELPIESVIFEMQMQLTQIELSSSTPLIFVAP